MQTELTGEIELLLMKTLWNVMHQSKQKEEEQKQDKRGSVPLHGCVKFDVFLTLGLDTAERKKEEEVRWSSLHICSSYFKFDMSRCV